MKLGIGGYSSKELLTVIIIVCMILVMLVPTILNIIEYSNNKILMNSVITFRQEIDRTLLLRESDEFMVQDGCYYVTASGDICLGKYNSSFDHCDTDILKIDLAGTKPVSGIVNIVRNRVSDIRNIRIKNLFVNVTNGVDYSISDEPLAQTFCKR